MGQWALAGSVRTGTARSRGEGEQSRALAGRGPGQADCGLLKAGKYVSDNANLSLILKGESTARPTLLGLDYLESQHRFRVVCVG